MQINYYGKKIKIEIMTKRVPKIVQKWVDNIKRTDPASQTKFYSKNAILLATFETMLIGREQIIGYMREFLDKQNMKARILENYTKVASLEEIKENDYNLNISFYVEKIVEDNLPSVGEAFADLQIAWNDSLEAETKFKDLFKDFVS